METFVTHFPSSVRMSLLKKLYFFCWIKPVWVIPRFHLLVQQEMPGETKAATKQSTPGHSKQNVLCALPMAFTVCACFGR